MIQYGERLKLLRFFDLLVKPILDLILLHLFKIFVIVVEMSELLSMGLGSESVAHTG